jgi:hypothetical protein
METCEVTFDETHPCNSSVFGCAGDDEVSKKIFEDEEDDVGTHYFHYDDYSAGWSIPYTTYGPARSSESSY